MGATHFEDPVNTRDSAGDQHLGPDLSVATGGCRHDDLGNLDHRRGYGVHDHGRRIDRLATRHVDPDARERTNAVPKGRTALFAHLPARRDPLAVECADPHRRFAQGRPIGGIDGVGGLVPLFAGDLDLVELGTVELPNAGVELMVSAVSHAFDDATDNLLHVAARFQSSV